MSLFFEQKLTQAVDICTNVQTYPHRAGHVTVQIDWPGICKKVQTNSGHAQPVVGGLYPHKKFNYFLPSFAYAGQNSSIICIYPGNWERKLYYSAGLMAGKSPADPKIVIACLLAHESHHITQGIRGYGWLKNLFVMPGIFLSLPAAALTLCAAALGLGDLWWALVFFVYYLAARNVYFFDPYERQARDYARKHYTEWMHLVTTSPAQQ